MQRVKIWDAFVRANHWLMALLVLGLWWSADSGDMELHLQLAGILGASIVVRILWGFFGSESARFKSFLRGPKAIQQHLSDLHQGKPYQANTHSALGGWAVVLMLIVLLVQFGTGLFADDDIFFSGPLASSVSSDLSSLLTSLHKDNFNILLALIVVHVAAITIYRLRGIGLVASMFHGKRAGAAAPKLVNGLLGMVAVALLATAFYYFIN